MTNSIAIGLFGAIVLAFLINFAMGWEAHIFLGKKMLDTIEWMKFWR